SVWAHRRTGTRRSRSSRITASSRPTSRGRRSTRTNSCPNSAVEVAQPRRGARDVKPSLADPRGPGVASPPSPAGKGVTRSYVELAGVTKTYRSGRGAEVRETHALTAVDLAIREGEFLAIVGPSGCGKS